jgi:glycosyltransferase involved in cell wall biosynthesis
MLILTNFERFPAQWTASTGHSGHARMFHSFRDCLQQLRTADLLVINCDVALTLRLCALFLICPPLRKPIVAVDFVLRAPETLKARIAVLFKRILLSRVNLFVHYFRDLRGYQRYYGIGPDRSRYVPFKPNLRYRFEIAPDSTGQYILCLGRSMRDYDTFLGAIAKLPYPAAIPKPDFHQLRVHESRFTVPLDRLPPHLSVLDDDGSDVSMLRILQAARLVVLPIVKTSLCASGIGTYLNAMLMRKCVILTDGPGASDVLNGEALICHPEDPDALAALIQKAWEDDSLRERTAEAGYRYALGLGGEPESRQRVLDVVCQHFAAEKPVTR